MKIALLGYGKMGKAIAEVAKAKGHEVVLIINSRNTEDLTNDKLQLADVSIDFSRPEEAQRHITASLNAGVPVISGTTGWLDKMDEVKAVCSEQKGAFLYASNFSIGVNLFFSLNKQLAKMMNAQPQYSAYLEEIHHTQKLDAPSGTGITLANDLINEVDRLDDWNKENDNSNRSLPVFSKRIDKVPGTHSIQWNSEIDSIEIKHTAHSRKGFVLGALMAAEWLVGKTGLFGMEDVLDAS